MATQMELDATTVLAFVVEKQERTRPQYELLGDEPPCTATGPEIHEGTQLSPGRINDAAALLESAGYVELDKWLGTAPYDFGELEVSALGRYELQRLGEAEKESPGSSARHFPEQTDRIARPPIPRGSPFGFEAQDWEFVETEWSRTDQLKVVFGHQWESDHFHTETLRTNLRAQFQDAVDAYSNEPASEPAVLKFVPLHGGYGEHLFNEIARDVISADIAVFDTSDLNPNVMIEMGVALTWGVRVLPIRAEGTASPPSDISGQMWVCYAESGSRWADGDHAVKILAMVRRAIRRKASS